MKKGFTLIELLVVVTVISVLMGLLLVAYQGTRKTARDGKRKAELEQIRNAIEVYRADCGGYPTAVSFGGSLTGPVGLPCEGNTYMGQVPEDPLDATYQYRYNPGAVPINTYTLCAYLEGETAITGTCAAAACGGECGTGITCNYKICNP